MSANNIYQDQENRMMNQRRLKREDRVLNVQYNALSKNGTQIGKRTVLSSISVNSNIRVQPSRAAKQGVCYESGAPQQQSSSLGPHINTFSSNSSQNDSNKSRSMSLSASSTSLQSNQSSSGIPSMGTSSLPFTIFEDPSATSVVPPSILQQSIQQKQLQQPPLSSSVPAPTFPSCSSSSFPKAFQTHQKQVALPSAPTNEDKENLVAKRSIRKAARKNTQQCLQSPEAMDISLSENFLMAVDTPMLPGEDILQSRDDDIYEVPQYAADIYKYLRHAETCHKPRVNYMSKQNDITAGMRWILVDWLVEVAEEYELHAETLFLAVSYVDRFLSQMSVKRDKLQLVGATAMFIASKYEEIYPPDVGQFAYITDNTYKKSQILRMEQLILKVLSFDMAVPTAYLFVNKFAKLCKSTKESTHLAYFLAELSMLDSDPFLRYLPSMIAASAVALANHTQGKPAWPEEVSLATQYKLTDLKECYINLHSSFCKVHEPSQHAIRDKYKAAKWNSVATLSPREGFPWS